MSHTGRIIKSFRLIGSLDLIAVYQCFSTGGSFAPPRNIWHHVETFLIVKPGREGEAATGIQWVEARDAAKHPAMHKAAAAALV